MKFIISLFLMMAFAMPTLMPQQAEARKYYRTVQEIQRKNPEYKYVVSIRSSASLLGGYDVTVQGFKKNDPNVDDNANFLSEWYWGKPDREDLMELVDTLHLSVREAMEERDWEKIRDEEMQKLLAEMQKKMREKFESDLQEALRQKMEEIKLGQDENKPMNP